MKINSYFLNIELLELNIKLTGRFSLKLKNLKRNKIGNENKFFDFLNVELLKLNIELTGRFLLELENLKRNENENENKFLVGLSTCWSSKKER